MTRKNLLRRALNRWREEGSKDFLQSAMKYIRIKLSFFTSQHRRRVVRAKRNRERIHYSHSINKESIILDVGAYKGDWTAGLIAKSEPDKVHLFEPIPNHIDLLEDRFGNVENINIQEYGVGGSTHTTEMAELDNSSSIYSESKETVTVKFKSATEVLEELTRDVDVMKINVEGSEYEIMFELIRSGMVKKVGTFIIQFHRNVPEYDVKRKEIHNELNNTHSLDINYPYVWEVWKRKER